MAWVVMPESVQISKAAARTASKGLDAARLMRYCELLSDSREALTSLEICQCNRRRARGDVVSWGKKWFMTVVLLIESTVKISQTAARLHLSNMSME
jgi:hypothetical protein